ncbi:MAG: hypothetical protein ACREF9_10935 [Opitutaceae bacterium]
MEVEEFVRRNADDAFLVQEGYFEILHERELKRKNAEQDARANVGICHAACYRKSDRIETAES